ncbi:MAG: DUF6790 family protein [Bacteroidota bacterium]
MAKWLGLSSMLIGAIGLFFGFYYLGENPGKALNIVTLTTVGIVGVLAFVRHVVFHKSDAKRLGWETERPDWMFEVGFANLAFGFMGFLTVLAHWGMQAQAVTVFGYAVYLFQASMLHGYHYFADPVRSPSRLWRSCLATLSFAGMMTYFTVAALSTNL